MPLVFYPKFIHSIWIRVSNSHYANGGEKGSDFSFYRLFSSTSSVNLFLEFQHSLDYGCVLLFLFENNIFVSFCDNILSDIHWHDLSFFLLFRVLLKIIISWSTRVATSTQLNEKPWKIDFLHSTRFLFHTRKTVILLTLEFSFNFFVKMEHRQRDVDVIK